MNESANVVLGKTLNYLAKLCKDHGISDKKLKRCTDYIIKYGESMYVEGKSNDVGRLIEVSPIKSDN